MRPVTAGAYPGACGPSAQADADDPQVEAEPAGTAVLGRPAWLGRLARCRATRGRDAARRRGWRPVAIGWRCGGAGLGARIRRLRGAGLGLWSGAPGRP